MWLALSPSLVYRGKGQLLNAYCGHGWHLKSSVCIHYCIPYVPTGISISQTGNRQSKSNVDRWRVQDFKARVYPEAEFALEGWPHLPSHCPISESQDLNSGLPESRSFAFPLCVFLLLSLWTQNITYTRWHLPGILNHKG